MKPMPASPMQAPTCSALSSILTPSACSTSAAPDFDDSARLPCLATGTPAPATMNAAQVEILNEPEASPPDAIDVVGTGGACTPSILARMVVTAPVISSTVSPRTRKPISSAPICEGVASPDIMLSKAAAACAPVLRSLSPTLLVPGGGEIDKILQHQMAVLGGDALGMELHAVHRQGGMRQAHHQTVAGFGVDGAVSYTHLTLPT